MPSGRALLNASDDDREFAFSAHDFNVLAGLVLRQTGIVLGGHKRDMLYGRLTPRIRQLGLPSFRAYVRHLKGVGGDSEIGFLVNALTTNLTRFFREPTHLDHLRDVTIPEALAALRPGNHLRMRLWSAGCATGEEPYSIAMVLNSCIENSHGIDAKILATDLDTAVLEKARAGLYPLEATDKIPDIYRKRYIERLSRDSRECRVHHDARRYVSFKYLNLLNK